jgi:hypothetical protein
MTRADRHFKLRRGQSDVITNAKPYRSRDPTLLAIHTEESVYLEFE